MSKTLLLQFLFEEGTPVPGEEGCNFFACHTCLTFLHGCFLGCSFLSCLCILNPLNGHLIVCPLLWKQACHDPTCNTAFVVLRNGLLRRGTLSLWPMSRMMKSKGMYVSYILIKISLATPSSFHDDWSAICSLKFAVDKGPPKILSYITLDLAPRSQKALWKTCGPTKHVIVRHPGSSFLVTRGGSTRFSWLFRRWGLPNLIEIIFIDSREVLGFPEVFPESKIGMVVASWAIYFSYHFIKAQLILN
jgi:hypothetical protein